MNDFKEIIEVIKDCISSEVKGIVLDRDVAKHLGLSASAMATAKSRNIIPFESVANWCAKKKIAINSVLFSQSVESLIIPTNDMILNRYQIAV